MRNYAKIYADAWINQEGKAIKKLGTDARLVSLYLMTNSHANMCGVYYLPIIFIAQETGLTFEGASKALQQLIEIKFCSYDHDLEYVWVHEMAFSQVEKQLKPNDKRVKAINEFYENLPVLPFLDDFYHRYAKAFHLTNKRHFLSLLEGASQGLSSQEQEQEQKQEQEHIIIANAEKTNDSMTTTNSHTVISIPLQQEKMYHVTQAQLHEWQRQYSTIDVLNALQDNRAWSLENHEKRKTEKTIVKHLHYWLNNAGRNTCHHTYQTKKMHTTQLNYHLAQSWAND